MDVADLGADPLVALARWLAAARAAGVTLPEAMALATVTATGSPEARMVIVRGFDEGLVFYTDRESDKGAQLAAVARAAGLFHWWQPVHRQVRVSGPVEIVSEEESDRYWASRPPGSRTSAAISHQSRVVPSRAFLERAVAKAVLRAEGNEAVARPARWGGYRILPESVEFWEEGPDRLHDRIRFRRGARWEVERLSP